MKVKIIKADYDSFWYSKHIGREFDVEEVTNDFKVLDNKQVNGLEEEATYYFINKDDCEVVEGEIKKSFIEKVYIHRQKEDNWDIVDRAVELGFNKTIANDLVYLGYEVEFEVEIFND
jgi:hypothetical protein